MNPGTDEEIDLVGEVLACIEGAASSNYLERERALEKAGSLVEQSESQLARAVARIVARALITDTESGLRSDAAGLLGDVGNQQDFHAIRVAATDAQWDVRAYAVSSAAKLFGKRAVPLIRRHLDDAHEIVRKYAAVALYDVLGCEVVTEYQERLGSEQWLNARIGLLYALAACGLSPAMKELVELTRHESASIYESAKQALKEIRIAHLERGEAGKHVD